MPGQPSRGQEGAALGCSQQRLAEGACPRAHPRGNFRHLCTGGLGGARLWPVCCWILWTVMYSTVLCCTVLYCVVLYCTVLYCNVLHCTVLYCTVMYCTVLYCTVLYCTVMYYMFCTVHLCTILSCTVLYCTIVQYRVIKCNTALLSALSCTDHFSAESAISEPEWGTALE